MTIAALLIAAAALIAAASAPLLALVRRSSRDRRTIADQHERIGHLEAAVNDLRRELPLGPPLVGRTVLVNTKKPDDQTFRGVLHGQYKDRWTLRDAIAVTPIGETPVPGGVYHVPVENISGAQEIQR